MKPKKAHVLTLDQKIEAHAYAMRLVASASAELDAAKETLRIAEEELAAEFCGIFSALSPEAQELIASVVAKEKPTSIFYHRPSAGDSIDTRVTLDSPWVRGVVSCSSDDGFEVGDRFFDYEEENKGWRIPPHDPIHRPVVGNFVEVAEGSTLKQWTRHRVAVSNQHGFYLEGQKRYFRYDLENIAWRWCSPLPAKGDIVECLEGDKWVPHPVDAVRSYSILVQRYWHALSGEGITWRWPPKDRA